jgi:hypothetical protein
MSTTPSEPRTPEAAPLPASATPRLAPRLSAPAAAALGWILLAPVNQVFILRLPRGKVDLSARLAQHTYEVCLLVAAGLLAAAAVAAWQRWAPKRRGLDYLPPALLAFGLGAALLPEDLAGVVEDLGGARTQLPLGWIVLGAVTLIVPAALAFGRLLQRWRVGWLGIAPALGAAIANDVILAGDYRGIHLFLGWFAATLGGASLTGLRLPRRLPSGLRARIAAVALLGAAAAASLLIRPSNVVRVEMARINGSIIAPLVARLRSAEGAGSVDVPAKLEPWFKSRADAPPVPPGPRLLPEDPVVVLVTIDSVRAELLEDPRYRERFPRLSALLEVSTQFTRARAPGPFTRVSIGSMFSGKYSSQLRWVQHRASRGWHLDTDASIRFPDVLKRAKIPSMNIVSYDLLVNKERIARGFSEEKLVRTTKGQRFSLSAALVDVAIDRLESHEGGPLFLYMHLMDPHYPYDAAGAEGPAFERYLGEVALCDTSVGRLVDALQDRGLWPRTALIVGADHGEAFGQHDTPYHGLTLYEELLRVPFFIRVPGDVKRVVDAPVSLIDVGSTVLDLFQQETPGVFMGQSLVPFLRGESPELLRPMVAESKTAHALVIGSRKVILDDEHGTTEIYDLSQDPAETRNLADLEGQQGKEADLLRAFLRAHTLDKAKSKGKGKKKK